MKLFSLKQLASSADRSLSTNIKPEVTNSTLAVLRDARVPERNHSISLPTELWLLIYEAFVTNKEHVVLTRGSAHLNNLLLRFFVNRSIWSARFKVIFNNLKIVDSITFNTPPAPLMLPRLYFHAVRRLEVRIRQGNGPIERKDFKQLFKSISTRMPSLDFLEVALPRRKLKVRGRSVPARTVEMVEAVVLLGKAVDRYTRKDLRVYLKMTSGGGRKSEENEGSLPAEGAAQWIVFNDHTRMELQRA